MINENGMSWREIVSDDFNTMHMTLNRIDEKLLLHLDKQAVVQYILPLKRAIFSVFTDLCNNNDFPIPYNFDHGQEMSESFCKWLDTKQDKLQALNVSYETKFRYWFNTVYLPSKL